MDEKFTMERTLGGTGRGMKLSVELTVQPDGTVFLADGKNLAAGAKACGSIGAALIELASILTNAKDTLDRQNAATSKASRAKYREIERQLAEDFGKE